MGSVSFYSSKRHSWFADRVAVVTAPFTEVAIVAVAVAADYIAATTVVHQQTFEVIASTKYSATTTVAVTAFTTISIVVNFPMLGDAILAYVAVQITHLTCCFSSFLSADPNSFPLSWLK